MRLVDIVVEWDLDRERGAVVGQRWFVCGWVWAIFEATRPLGQGQ